MRPSARIAGVLAAAPAPPPSRVAGFRGEAVSVLLLATHGDEPRLSANVSPETSDKDIAMNHPLLSLLALTVLTGAAQAQLLYGTGFETPQFVNGQSIDGVDGWASLFSPQAVTVVHGRSQSSTGRSSLRCWGGDPNLQSTLGLLDAAVTQPGSVDPTWAASAIVYVHCDVRLDGPDTGTGPADDLVSANLYVRNGVGGTPFMYVSSTGQVFCFAGSVGGFAAYQFATPVALGQYHRLAMMLDYSQHLVVFSVDGVPIGVLPFGGQATEAFNGAILEFAAYDDPLFVDPTLYTGHWDNFLMVAWPSGS